MLNYAKVMTMLRLAVLSTSVTFGAGCGLSDEDVPDQEAVEPPQAVSGGWSTFPSTCIQSWCVNHGNLVRLWQSILWADNMFTDLSQIDGDFGPNTDGWMHNWQVKYVPGDNSHIVGPNTWNTAGSHLDFDTNGDTCQFGVYHFVYVGASRRFRLTENCSTFEWKFVNPRTGTLTDTTYDY